MVAPDGAKAELTAWSQRCAHGQGSERERAETDPPLRKRSSSTAITCTRPLVARFVVVARAGYFEEADRLRLRDGLQTESASSRNKGDAMKRLRYCVMCKDKLPEGLGLTGDTAGRAAASARTGNGTTMARGDRVLPRAASGRAGTRAAAGGAGRAAGRLSAPRRSGERRAGPGMAICGRRKRLSVEPGADASPRA